MPRIRSSEFGVHNNISGYNDTEAKIQTCRKEIMAQEHTPFIHTSKVNNFSFLTQLF